jgi:Putative adhesin
MVRPAIALALVALALPSAALVAQRSNESWLRSCRERSWRESRAKYCEVRETGFKPTGRALTVDPAVNGGVEIIGWDDDSIAVTARIQVSAYSEDDGAEVARAIRIDARAGTVRAEGPSSMGRHQGWSVSFIVRVPHRTDLSIDTENGPLSVHDVTGRMDLTTMNGPLALLGVGGEVHARAQNGPLEVSLTGARWEGAGLDAETQNGPADLEIPDGYNAQVEFGTVNGPMHVGFPITVTINGRVRDRISTKLGDGGAPIRVVTTNGPMTVRRQ